jgi:toxin ParE1/3/4
LGYRTTPAADRDIIVLYIEGVGKFGVRQADRYYGGLIDCFELLAAQPLIARERREFRRPVRIHFHRSHVVVYEATDNDILIVRVLHGRQDWRELL